MNELEYWKNYLQSQLKFINIYNWRYCEVELKNQIRIKESIIFHIINLKYPNLDNYKRCSLFNYISSQSLTDLINNDIEILIDNYNK